MKDRPAQYGLEFHGRLSRDHAQLLCRTDGEYLVRESSTESGQHCLVLRINGEIKNYRLYFDQICRLFYVGDKKFESLNELVTDGIIHLFIEAKAKSYIESMTKHSVYVEMKKAIESEEEIDARVVPRLVIHITCLLLRV